MKSKPSGFRGSFSIVIPFLGRYALLAKSLSSIAGQTGIDFGGVEVILVDDGSEGRFSWRQEAFPFSVKYVYLPRTGESSPARARNHGVALARNDILVFLDSDIWLPADYLDRLGRYFQKGKPTAVVGTRIMVPEESSHDPTGPRLESLRNDPAFFEFRHKVLARYSFNMRCIRHPWLIGYTCNLAVDRPSVLKTGGFDERFLGWGMEDVEFSYRLHRNKVRFLLGHDTEVFHLHHETRADADPEGVLRNTERNFRFFLGSHPELSRKIPPEDLLGMFQARVSIHKALNNLSRRKSREFTLDEGTAATRVVLWILWCAVSRRRIVLRDVSAGSGWSLFVQRLPWVRAYYFPVVSRPYLIHCRFEYSC